MRSKLSLYNSLSGIIFQSINLFITFLSRSFFIKFLSVEFLGLNGLFLNIMGILSIAELGLGTAITVNLYKPIREENEDKIRGIYELYKKAFTFIGIFLFFISIIISFFVPSMVKGSNISNSMIILYFLLFSLNTSSSYLFATNRTIFFAYQKNFIVIKNDIIFLLLRNVVQIILLFVFHNYILYLIIEIFFTWLGNFYLELKLRKKYSFLFLDTLNTRNNISKREIFSSVGNVSILKIVGVGVNSTDNIIISSFIGITITGVFSNYLLIFNAIFNFIGQFFNGVLASLGDLIVEQVEEKIRFMYSTINFLCFLFASLTILPLFFSSTKFIQIWLGKEYVLSSHTVLLLAIIHYLKVSRQINWFFVSTSGIFSGYMSASIVEVIVNLAVSLLFVQKFGLNGILIGTIIASLVSWIGQTIAVHKHILHTNAIKYFIRQLLFAILIILQFLICFFCIKFIDDSSIAKGDLTNLLLTIFISLTFPVCLNILCFIRKKEFQYLYDKIKLIFRR